MPVLAGVVALVKDAAIIHQVPVGLGAVLDNPMGYGGEGPGKSPL